MKIEPLTPGLYICRFSQSIEADNINRILEVLNDKGEPFGVSFIPELPEIYQISNQVKEDNK